VRDSVFAIADANYFDWPVLPEAPGPLLASLSGAKSIRLTWAVHGGDPTSVRIERRVGDSEAWETVAKLPASATEYVDSQVGEVRTVCYRARVEGTTGESAYSNIARVRM